jgi:HK97 family phage major capsid protein
MNEWEKFFKQAKEKLIAAKALLEGDAPDMEQIKALQAEAAQLQERAEAMKAVAGSLAAIAEPQLPADLPADPEPAPQATDNGDGAIKALYNLRFGEPEAATRAILVDLHGADYEQKRWAQWMGFNHWLRDYSNPVVPREGKAFLWTPDTIKTALMEGQDVRAMKTVMVEAQDTLGGYIVPEDWRAQLIQRMMGIVIMRGRATPMTTSRDAVEVPEITGGDSQYTSAVRVTWVDETPTAGTAATNLTFGQKRIPVHTVMAETFLSRNLIEDAAFNLASLLSEKFAEAAAIDEDNHFLTGDGNGKPEGILPSSANALSITEAITGHATLIDDWDAIIDLVYSVDSQYRQPPSCSFVAEKATYQALAKIKWTESYVWDRAERMGGKMEGYTYLEQEAMPTIGAGAFPMVFGDLRAYVIVDRIGMSVERYLDSATARINQVCYVMRRRLGGQCAEPHRLAVLKVSAT